MFLVSRIVHVLVAGQFWSLDDARPSFRLPLSRCRRPLQPKACLPGYIFKLTHHAMGGVAAHSTCHPQVQPLTPGWGIPSWSSRSQLWYVSQVVIHVRGNRVDSSPPIPFDILVVLVVHFAFAGVEEPDGWVRSVGSFRALSDSSGRGG